MKIGMRAVIAGKRRRLLYPDDFFDREEGFEDLNGALLCPVCTCCALTQVERVIERGWARLSGCSRSVRHTKKAA
jgi:hypothetical protein